MSKKSNQFKGPTKKVKAIGAVVPKKGKGVGESKKRANPEGKKVAKDFIPQVIDKYAENSTVKLKMLKDKCLYMYGTGKPFVLIKSGNSYKLESGLFNSTAIKGGFSVSDITFIKRVKNYVNKNAVALKFVDEDYQGKPIHYIDVKQFVEGEVLSDLIEIDIDKAYWETAYMLGVIDKGIYYHGLSNKVSKVVRLAALGSLAKKKERWDFDGVSMTKGADVRSTATENIWFAICKRVSDVMQDAMRVAGDDFVFYWVDGMYIRNTPEALGRVMQCMAKWGYESKMKVVKEIVFSAEGFSVQGVIQDDVREFSYPSSKGYTVADYNEDYRLKQLARDIFFKGRKEKKDLGRTLLGLG